MLKSFLPTNKVKRSMCDVVSASDSDLDPLKAGEASDCPRKSLLSWPMGERDPKTSSLTSLLETFRLPSYTSALLCSCSRRLLSRPLQPPCPQHSVGKQRATEQWGGIDGPLAPLLLGLGVSVTRGHGLYWNTALYVLMTFLFVSGTMFPN